MSDDDVVYLLVGNIQHRLVDNVMKHGIAVVRQRNVGVEPVSLQYDAE